MEGYLAILLTISFTVYGQLVMKWQMNDAGPMPPAFWDKLVFLMDTLFNFWVLSAFVAAFLAALAWMAALNRFHLSYAYPFMSLAFVLILGLSAVIFNEPVTLPKVLGMALIVAGIVLGSQG